MAKTSDDDEKDGTGRGADQNQIASLSKQGPVVACICLLSQTAKMNTKSITAAVFRP